MVVSRRGFLWSSGAVAVVAAFGPSFLQAASAAPALTGKDLELLRNRWVDSLTGRHLIPNSPASFAPAISDLDERVDTLLTKVSPTDNRFFADRDWSVGVTETTKTNNMRMNYVDLQVLAIAWATPGSSHKASAAVLDVLKRGLEHMYTKIYNPQTKWWGNWWSWNIGSPQPLANMMAILHSELDQTEIDKYCEAIDHFIPGGDPKMQAHPTGPMESDGANRVDICQGMAVRAIVQPNPALLSESAAALSPTWQYVTEGNGFFRDGSFVQHSTIGYTGTYGLVLLEGLSKLFALLAGTAFDITDETRSNLLGVIDGSFAPLMYNGQMMDAVRGRAICRTERRSIDDGNNLIEGTLRLAAAADAQTAERWRGLCKQWILNNDAENITASSNISRLALVIDLLSSDVAAVEDATGPHMFPAMDRLVHRSPNNDWALCLAMCSNRIAWSEGSPEENFNGVKTSQGMTYLYLADDDDHFDDEFWATSDMEAPAGTTVDMTPLGPNPEGTWGEATPKNEWTGGVQLGDMAVAGMHLVAPGGTGLVARKMWVTLPDMVVALGTDISTASDAEVRTVVEHRNLGTKKRILLVDGEKVTSPTQLSSPKWAHLAGVGGYLFLDEEATIQAGVADREGSWQRNTTNVLPGTDTVHHRQYGTLAIHHGMGKEVAGSTYAYALLPTASKDQTVSRAASPGMTILGNDATAQGVNLPDGVTAATFWKAGTTGDFTSDASVCLLARRGKKRMDIALSDPTQQQDVVRLTVAGMDTRSVEGPDAQRVTFEQKDDNTMVVIDTSGTAGMTVTFSLKGIPDGPEPSPSSSTSPTPTSSPSATSSPSPTSSPSTTSSPSATSSPSTTSSASPTASQSPTQSTSATRTTSPAPTRTSSSSAAPTSRPTTSRPTKRPGLPHTGA